MGQNPTMAKLGGRFNVLVLLLGAVIAVARAVGLLYRPDAQLAGDNTPTSRIRQICQHVADCTATAAAYLHGEPTFAVALIRHKTHDPAPERYAEHHPASRFETP